MVARGCGVRIDAVNRLQRKMESMMLRTSSLAATLIASVLAVPALADPATPNDAQIAHIAYTAGEIDVAAGKQALAKSKNPQVRKFAQEMVRDHAAVNVQALSLVTKLHLTPQDNATSAALKTDADAKLKQLAALKGREFDRAYIENEISYHKAVNSALESTLIPSARNSELKDLLQTGLKLFQAHEQHAEHVLREAR
jgi:putative membrane protein